MLWGGAAEIDLKQSLPLKGKQNCLLGTWYFVQ
jgi:hypothetical protein